VKPSGLSAYQWKDRHGVCADIRCVLSNSLEKPTVQVAWDDKVNINFEVMRYEVVMRLRVSSIVMLL
jgi:hypothetical protein